MRKRRRLWTLSEYVQLTEVLLLPAVRTSREALKELHRRHVCEDLQSADDVKRALRNLKKKNLANIGTGFDAPPSADPQGVIRIAEYQLRVAEEDDRQRKVIRANLAKLADFERLGPASPAAEADTRATLIQQGAAQKEARVARRQSGAATTEALLGVRGSVRFFFLLFLFRRPPPPPLPHARLPAHSSCTVCLLRLCCMVCP